MVIDGTWGGWERGVCEAGGSRGGTRGPGGGGVPYTDPSPVKVRRIASNTVMIDIIRLHKLLQQPGGSDPQATLIFD